MTIERLYFATVTAGLKRQVSITTEFASPTISPLRLDISRYGSEGRLTPAEEATPVPALLGWTVLHYWPGDDWFVGWWPDVVGPRFGPRSALGRDGRLAARCRLARAGRPGGSCSPCQCPTRLHSRDDRDGLSRAGRHGRTEEASDLKRDCAASVEEVIE